MVRLMIIADPITEIRNLFRHMKRIEDVAVGGAETALNGFRRDQKKDLEMIEQTKHFKILKLSSVPIVVCRHAG